jgi:carboxyl-terminal processing protease
MLFSGKFDPSKLLPDMKFTKSLLVFSFVGLAGAAFMFGGRATSLFNNGDPSPQKEAELMRTLLDGIQRMHFDPKPVDDNLSKDWYNLYLTDMDGAKRFYSQEDINALEGYEKQLDDQALAGTYTFFDISVQKMEAALNKTQGWYKEILAKPLDFSANETVEMDGKKVKWAKNDADLRRRWELMLKYEVLTRAISEDEKQQKADYKGEKKSFDTLEKESREKVLDIYEKWYKRLLKMDRARRMEIYLNALTTVFDPHTGYFSPKEKESFDIQMSGKLEGIGARLQSDGEKTTVTEIVAGGPAWKQGELEAKDVVVKVGQGNEEPVDVMGWDIDDVVSKIRGKKGTVVKLTILKPDASTKEITITRDVVIMEEGFAKSLILHNDNQTEKIGYIYLPKFYADFTPQGVTSCHDDVKKEVDKLKKDNVKGIILDLRNNGGGSLRDVVKMSGLFIESGPIVQVKSRNRRPEIMSDTDRDVEWNGPFVVMVNEGSASASEILAAAMQDYKRALIVGSSGTYGKGTVQRFLDLDQMSNQEGLKPLGEMKLTVQKFYRINGKTTQLDGVTPDIILPDFYNLLKNGESENDYPLSSTTIDPVEFGQAVYQLPDVNTLRTASEKRVAANETFKKVNDNAMRFRKMKDQSTYLLQLDKYRQYSKRQNEEADKYDDMFKPIDAFVIENLSSDVSYIQSDTSRIARNDNWMKERKKDIQLYETLQIMNDMIRLDGVAGKQ